MQKLPTVLEVVHQIRLFGSGLGIAVYRGEFGRSHPMSTPKLNQDTSKSGQDLKPQLHLLETHSRKLKEYNLV